MPMTFKTGQIVKLRSGGPDMTVEQVGIKPWNDEPVVYCAWFEDVSSGPPVVRRDSFHPRVLQLSESGRDVGRIDAGAEAATSATTQRGGDVGA
jgi:uncharacterized protein YodC (DUF2158 family)